MLVKATISEMGNVLACPMLNVLNSTRQIYSLRNDTMIDWSKPKTFADDNSNVAKCVFERVENIVGKGENAGNQHFLLFQQCFQKASFLGTL